MIADDDDSGTDSNPRIILPVQAGGTYFIRVKQYDDDEPAGRYCVRAYRDVLELDSYEPDDSRETARSIEINGDAQEHTVHAREDLDWIRFEISKSDVYVVRTLGELDTVLKLYDQRGTLVSEDDDSAGDSNALIAVRLRPGVYYCAISGYEDETVSVGEYSVGIWTQEDMK